VAGRIRKILFSLSTLKGLLFLVLMLMLYLWARSYDLSLEAMRQGFADVPPWKAALVFVAVYVFVSVAPVSARDACKIVGAVLFGILPSALYIWIAEIVAAVVSYWLARLMGRDLVESLAGRRLDWINRKLEEAGFRNMMILRLLPVTPYRYLNYISGLTSVGMRDYLLAAVLGSLPRVLAIQAALFLFADAVLSGEAGASALFWANLGLILLMVVSLWAVYKGARMLWPGWFADGPKQTPRED